MISVGQGIPWQSQLHYGQATPDTAARYAQERILPRFLLLAALPALAACQNQPEIAVSDATIAVGPRSAAVYAVIANNGGGDRLTGIEFDGRARVGLHLSTNQGGVMRMRPAASIDVPANGSLELRSSGAHGMVMGPLGTRAPVVPLTFHFERSAPVSVRARVMAPGAAERQQ